MLSKLNVLGAMFVIGTIILAVFASANLEFMVYLNATNESGEWISYDHAGQDIDLFNTFFTNFSAELVGIAKTNDEIFSSSGSGEYYFEGALLNASGEPLVSKQFPVDFYVLSDPPTEFDEMISFMSFPYAASAKSFQLKYNSEIILEEEFGELLCNYNGTCENPLLGFDNMFENYLSCPQDCNYFSNDDICNIAPGKDYSSSDNYCDLDCLHDIESDGDCNVPSCNDGVKNQDETAVDVGGVCEFVANEYTTIKDILEASDAFGLNNFNLVIGDSASAMDNVISIDIAGELETGYTRPASYYNYIYYTNLIVLGNPSVNRVARSLTGNSFSNSLEGFEEGRGRIELYHERDSIQILIAGYDAEQTENAARILLDRDLWHLMDTDLVITSEDGIV
ncbi:hypothetical protein HN747_04115 [archaeon]|jgi:hypothetical protein|nr:hypothetical protein [archaeon]